MPSLTEAAKISGLSKFQIKELIKHGYIPNLKIGNINIISYNDARQLKEFYEHMIKQPGFGSAHPKLKPIKKIKIKPLGRLPWRKNLQKPRFEKAISIRDFVGDKK